MKDLLSELCAGCKLVGKRAQDVAQGLLDAADQTEREGLETKVDHNYDIAFMYIPTLLNPKVAELTERHSLLCELVLETEACEKRHKAQADDILYKKRRYLQERYQRRQVSSVM